MMDIQILHMWNNVAKEQFCIVFWSKKLTHVFPTVDEAASSMDQKCKLSMAAAIEITLYSFFYPYFTESVSWIAMNCSKKPAVKSLMKWSISPSSLPQLGRRLWAKSFGRRSLPTYLKIFFCPPLKEELTTTVQRGRSQNITRLVSGKKTGTKSWSCG